MDPEEVMKRMRDAMIEISDLVGSRLVLGGSSLTKSQIEEAVASAEQVVEHGQALLEYAARGGYLPGARR